MTKNDLIDSRLALPGDKNFIMATMLRGLYYGDSIFSLMKKDTFMNNYKYLVECLWSKELTKVACLKSDPSVIIGYVILSPDNSCLHWAFCKKDWRHIGVIRDLVPSSVTTVSHLTKIGAVVCNKKAYEFNPLAAFTAAYS